MDLEDALTSAPARRVIQSCLGGKPAKADGKWRIEACGAEARARARSNRERFVTSLGDFQTTIRKIHARLISVAISQTVHA